MFDDLLRQLDRIPKKESIPISLSLDDEGYLDRRCPGPECGAAFKVLFTDWRVKVPDERCWCAICGEIADPHDFNTPDQERQIRDTAIVHVQGQLDDAMRRAPRPTINARGLIAMSWSYQPGERHVVVPAAEPAMSQRSVCESCGTRYASVGVAFFCPACGHNSARTTFAGALATIRTTMDLAERMPSLIEDRDVAADTARQMTENSLVRVWSSFQRFAEAGYASHPASVAKPARRNAFQNLAESDGLWRGAIGRTYEYMLTAPEHRDLLHLVQARHILVHRDGIVDGDYVAKSGDHRYRVGQRLVVTPLDVRTLADLAEKLAAGLTAALP
jgi:hypothetical protein